MRLKPTDLTAPGHIPGSIPGLPLAGGDNWIAKINEMIAGINQLFQQYNQLRQNLPGAFQQPGGMELQGSPPGGDPTAKMLQGARSFVTNLQKQGMGDQPLSQVISQMPETVNQVAALLDQLIARSGKAKGIKGA